MTKIKSMGKIAAVSVMSVLVSISFNGCGFFDSMLGGDSTSAQSSSSLSGTTKSSDSGILSSLFGSDEKKDNIQREKCNGNEQQKSGDVFNGRSLSTVTYKEKGECKSGLKEGVWKSYDTTGYIVLRESTYKKGILDGISKLYNDDEALIEETHYKNGIKTISTFYNESKNAEEFGDFGKKSDKIVRDYYDDGTNKLTRFYKDGIIIYLHYKQQNITRAYYIIDIFAKEKGLEQAYLPTLKAKYGKALNDAMKKDGRANDKVLECVEAVDEVEKYNKGEIRIQPSAQTIKLARECQNSPDYKAGMWNMTGDYMSFVTGVNFDVSATSKVQAQMKADYESYAFSELKKHSAKFTKDEDILAYVKNAQPFSETIKSGNFALFTKPYIKDGIGTHFLIDNKIVGALYHSRNQQNACVAQGSGNCRAFSRQFKELIDKSAFKDTIYNLLPKPRNQ